VAFAAVLLGPSLVGVRVFAATDILEITAPWQASSTWEQEPVNRCVSDTVDGALPAILETRERLSEGDLPLWNDEVLAGAPLTASPLQGVLSPLVLASIALPPALVPGWAKLLEVAVVGAGCLLLAGRLGLHRGAAAVAAVSFASSGFLVMWTNWPQARTAAFFPLMLWAVERVLQDRTWRSVVPLPFALAGLVLGGFPAVVVYLAYFLVAWVLVRWWWLRRDEGWRAVLRSGYLLAAGGALGATALLAQLVTMGSWLLEVSLGDRSHGTPALDLHPTAMSTVFFPQALGLCNTETSFWGAVSPVEGTSFVGVAVLFLALVALVLPRPARLPRGMVGLLAVVAGVTFGGAFVGGPVADVLVALPGVGSSPIGRTRSVGGLALAVLAAIGLHALLRPGRAPGRLRRVLLPLGTGLLLAVAAVTLGFASREAAASTETGWAVVSPSFLPAYVAGGLCVLTALTVALARDRATALLAALLPIAVLAEGVAFADAVWARPDPGTFYRTTPVHAYLETAAKGERIASVGRTMYHGAETAYELRSLTGHSFASPEWNQVVEVIDPEARRTPSFTVLSNTSVFTRPGLDRLSVAYLVAEPDGAPPGRDVTVDLPDGARSTMLRPSEAVTVPALRPVLGAAYLDVTRPPEVAGTLSVQLLSATGTVVARGSADVSREGRVPVRLEPVGKPAPGARLRVRTSTDVHVRATGEGTLWLGQLVSPTGVELVLDDGAPVYRNTDALPRYRWASDRLVVVDAARRAETVARRRLPADTVVLREDVGSFSGRPATIEVLQDDGDSRRVLVDAEGDGMLVVADGLFDGWTATVDGAPVPLVAADHALMGVPVPAGRSEVQIDYRTTAPRAVQVASVAGAAVMILSLLLLLPRQRRSEPRTPRPPPDPRPGDPPPGRPGGRRRGVTGHRG